MPKHKKICVLGGDARSVGVVRRLLALGGEVSAWGLGALPAAPGLTVVATWEEAILGCDAVILPIPAFDAEGRLFAPAAAMPPTAAEVLGTIGRGVPVYGGRLTNTAIDMAEKMGVSLTELLEMPAVVGRNAALTAEGAIHLVMGELDIALSDAKVAVLGYGRIGSRLAELLLALGAKVCVGARRREVLTDIAARGITPLDLTDAATPAELCEGYDVILNTVPHRLLSGEALTALPRETLLVELASAPGGWDPAKRIPCRVIYAPGLPARYAPMSAGAVIAEAVWEEVRG